MDSAGTFLDVQQNTSIAQRDGGRARPQQQRGGGEEDASSARMGEMEDVSMGVAEAADDRVLFTAAPQPDVARAAQKDMLHQSALTATAQELLTRLMGSRIAMRVQREVQLLTDLYYHCVTTLRGQQTLGEEYCDIAIVHARLHVPPSLPRRIVYVFAHVILPYLLERVLVRMPHREMLSSLTKFLTSAHMMFFYYTGAFYHFSKRLTSLQYVLTRKITFPRPSYELLGVLLLIQLVITSVVHAKKTLAALHPGAASLDEGYTNAEESSKWICILCLEKRKHTTATPCGHLFCWGCIHEAARNKAECPLCRTQMDPQTLIRVYHYE